MIRRLALALTLSAAPAAALAHPIDEVVQGVYLTLAPGGARLQLELTPGTLVVDGVLSILDANHDRRISDSEGRAYAERLIAQSSLSIDGKAARLKVTSVAIPAYEALRQGAPMRIEAVAARLDRAGEHTLSYDNRYAPAASRCTANIFLQPGQGWRYSVTGQSRSEDGRRLSVRFQSAR